MTKAEMEKEIRLLKDQLAEALLEKNTWKRNYKKLQAMVQKYCRETLRELASGL